MKDSGVPWLGEVPEHWNLERAKWLFWKMDRPMRDTDDVVTCFRDGMVTLRKNRRVRGFTESIKEIGYQGIRRGDLVIHAMDAFAGAIGVADSDGKGSPVYSVCQPASNANAHYYAYTVREMARSQWIQALAKGIRERSTDFRFDGFGSQTVPLPPLPEQSAIVRFLDHAERKIRRYIRGKQKLIKLLEEQKQAIIYRAVTRGLDPNVRLKPSGVEWLGDIPEHWEVRRLKTLVWRIDQGVSPQAENYLAQGDTFGVLKSGCVNHGVFRENEHKRLPAGFVFDSRLVVVKGDVLISRASGSPHLVGSAGRVTSITYKLILSDKTFRPVFNQDVDPDFMVLAMNSRYYRQQVEQAISGAEGLANNLPSSSLRSFVFVIPPLDEQRDIRDNLRREIEEILTISRQTDREISLLREYRTRLIADVVTGKLDVRGVAIPDITEEEPPALDEDVPDAEDMLDETTEAEE
jgi:type I restriction enzyme S subunit